MNLGYSKALYLLPFDHRRSYVEDGDPALNLRQVGRLKRLSEHCRRSQRRFMFELLVPPIDDQLARASGSKGVFDRQARPLLMQQTMVALQEVGIEPDVWKVEGLDSHADGERIVLIKVNTARGWFAARPSGTEDIYKIYAESLWDPNTCNASCSRRRPSLTRRFRLRRHREFNDPERLPWSTT